MSQMFRSRATTAIVVALGAVLIGALALYVMRTGPPAAVTDATPTPSPTAAVTATSTASGSPAVTPTTAPTPAATGREYGYVFTENEQRILVRRERDGSLAFELSGVAPGVSPDGTQIAYWRTGGDHRGIDLRVVEVADPSTDRSVFEVDERTFGGALAWSTDGGGLLIATYSRESASEHPLSGPAHYDLLMLDLTATPATTRPAAARLTGGWVYVPVLWDRAGQKAAAVITGEGGYTRQYVTWDGSVTSPFATKDIGRSMLADSIQASPDGELLMGHADDGSLVVWHVDDPAGIVDVDRQGQLGIVSVWRPGACGPCQAIVTIDRAIETFFWETDRREILYSSSTELVGTRAIRPDGSAVLITASPGGGPPPSGLPTHRVLVLEIDSKSIREIVGFTFRTAVLERGVILRQ